MTLVSKTIQFFNKEFYLNIMYLIQYCLSSHIFSYFASFSRLVLFFKQGFLRSSNLFISLKRKLFYLTGNSFKKAFLKFFFIVKFIKNPLIYLNSFIIKLFYKKLIKTFNFVSNVRPVKYVMIF